MWRRVLGLVVCGLVLYGVAPAVLDVLDAWPQVVDIELYWFAAMVLAQVLSWASMWLLQRLAVDARSWWPVVTSQLASGALGRVVPGGARGGRRAAVPDARRRPASRRRWPGSGSASPRSSCSRRSPRCRCWRSRRCCSGSRCPSGCGRPGCSGSSCSSRCSRSARRCWPPTARSRGSGGRGSGSAGGCGRASRRPPTCRNAGATSATSSGRALGRRWWEAVAGGAGRWLFDWLTLVTALAAVGQHPRPTLILLSFCAAQLLAQVPITPGGLGVVEAGLTGTLVLIGVPAAAAAVATLAYRLVSYWLALPAGGVAYLVHRRHIRRGHVSVPRISALSLTRPGRVGRLRHHLDPVPGGAAHERPRSVPGVAAGRELEPCARERGERGLVVVRDDRDMALVGTIGSSSGIRWICVASLPTQTKRSRSVGGATIGANPSRPQNATHASARSRGISSVTCWSTTSRTRTRSS